MWRMLRQEKPTTSPSAPEWPKPRGPSRLLADPSKARRELSWTATTGFDELVAMMVDAAPA
jgi:GDP-D-mannose dehydratase